jgi:hypothetical protein
MAMFVGLDVSLKTTSICVVEADERQVSAVAANILDRSFEARLPTANGLPTLPTSGRPRGGSMSRRSSIVLSARCRLVDERRDDGAARHGYPW